MIYETDYLMHFNKNHDKLGRFAKGRGGSSSKKQNANQRQRLSKYSNDDLLKKSSRLELENRYLNAEKRNSAFDNDGKVKESGSKKVLKAIGKIGGKTLSAVASGVGMVLAVSLLEQYGILRNSNDKAIFLKFIK